jgi:hypothetical protein
MAPIFVIRLCDILCVLPEPHGAKGATMCGKCYTQFYGKTECISLCVPGSSFIHKVTNSGINSITSVYYIVSYYKNLLQVQKGLSNGKYNSFP